MKLPRVILADDHTMVAKAVRQLIAPDLEVVATVADGHALIDAALSLKPDAVVVDVAMPLLNGLEACRQLKARMPGLRIIFLTMNEDPELALEAMRIGASGYVLKTSTGSELRRAILAALRGKTRITRTIKGCNEYGRSHLEPLRWRQREVVQLLAEGKSIKEAANVLGVTYRTVAFHKYRAMQEVGCKTHADLIRFAVKRHIVVG